MVAAIVLSCGCAASGNGPETDPDAATFDAQLIQGDAGTLAVPGPCRLDTDLGPDSVVDRRDFRTYEGGLLVRIERDNDVNGVLDYVQTRSYDEDGRLIGLSIDTNADGAIDDSRVYNIGLNGKTASIDFDTNNDGTLDQIWRYLYDTDDRLDSIERDTNADTVVDVLERYYRALNNTVYRIDRDTGLDGTIDFVEIRAYVDNLLQVLERDTDGDGDLEFRQSYHRDSDSKVIRVEIDRQADDIAEEHLLYLYECGAI